MTTTKPRGYLDEDSHHWVAVLYFVEVFGFFGGEGGFTFFGSGILIVALGIALS
jgi:hypothetical protein